RPPRRPRRPSPPVAPAAVPVARAFAGGAGSRAKARAFGVRPRIAIIFPWLSQTHPARTSLMVNDGPVRAAGHPTFGGGADMTRALLVLTIGFGLGVGGMSAARHD